MVEKKDKKKNVWVGRGILICIVAFFMMMSYFRMKSEGVFQELFHKKSGIKIESLNENQVKELNKLCKVWGFVKYHHPKVIASSVDWDLELFRIIPKVTEANDSGEVDKVLYDWINEMGEVEVGSDSGGNDVLMTPDIAWIKDQKFISKKLSDLLVKLSKTYISERDKGHVSFKEDPIRGSFKNEKPYSSMTYDDDGYKLLSLFRYWNIIQYYYPYREVMGEDWDAVLTEFIPKFIACKDSLSYKLTVAELTTKIHDSHVQVADKKSDLARYWGAYTAPIKFQLVEDKIVITEIVERYAADCKAQIGDIVLKLNDKDIFEVIKEKAKYKSTSRDEEIVRDLSDYLFRNSEESLSLTLDRDGKVVTEDIKCYNLRNMFAKPEESHKLLEGSIGYINSGALAKGEIDKIMKEFKETKGLIIDLRYYPSDFILYTLGNYLMPQKAIFAKMTSTNHAVPGEFTFFQDMEVGKDNPDFYKGKVIIIINEYTVSQAEFTTMALRKAPNAQVIGSNSIGADGDVAVISLPGGIDTSFSGLGVYYPDKSETQRVGIKPDIYIEPTIQGIRQGRDELVEKAVEVIKN